MKKPVYDYKDLDVWKLSMDLVECVYSMIKGFPVEERYVLSDQMRRSAISIPSNIAEGSSRKSTKEFIQFLYIALGSSSELETQLLLAKRLEYSDITDVILSDLIIIKKMINSLLKSLRSKSE